MEFQRSIGHAMAVKISIVPSLVRTTETIKSK